MMLIDADGIHLNPPDDGNEYAIQVEVSRQGKCLYVGEMTIVDQEGNIIYAVRYPYRGPDE